MENTMLIQLTDQRAVKLLHELEELNLIKVLQENVVPTKARFSDKYKGILNKDESQKLNKHIKKMRSEWNDI